MKKIKRIWRVFVFLFDWMPKGWNPDEMTRAFWDGE